LLIDVVRKLVNMPMLDRVDVLLSAANVANKTLMAGYPNTYEVCSQAIQKCREWSNGGDIAPETLAEYLDADESDNPWMRESLFGANAEGLNALVFITMIVGHVAYLAYTRSGKADCMSQVICEADESILEYISDYGREYGLLELI